MYKSAVESVKTELSESHKLTEKREMEIKSLKEAIVKNKTRFDAEMDQLAEDYEVENDRLKSTLETFIIMAAPKTDLILHSKK